MISLDDRHRAAVKFAAEETRKGRDWQEVQTDLINSPTYEALFVDLDDDAIYEVSLSIVREGEEIVDIENKAEEDEFLRASGYME